MPTRSRRALLAALPIVATTLVGVGSASAVGSDAHTTADGGRAAASGRIFGPGHNPRILALGDSITYGYTGTGIKGRGGYRPPLYQAFRSRGWRFQPVGPIVGPPTGSRHAGFPGFRIRDLATGQPGVTPSAVTMMNWYHPDVILLHIGTNDFSTHDDVAHAAQRADALIDSMVRARPTASIFVARIVNSYAPVPVAEVAGYNNAVAAHVRTLASRGKHVYSVNLTPAVRKRSDTGDGVHPTNAAYARMAKIWYDRVAQVNAGRK